MNRTPAINDRCCCNVFIPIMRNANPLLSIPTGLSKKRSHFGLSEKKFTLDQKLSEAVTGRQSKIAKNVN
ncbi:hypothetical protein [Pantoea deleyi]|uniref:hypothetical protein n=1 Tax=Pantoea deleyi TaxID=470932 RepID=UPI00138FD1AC|nr:hypothetical protein [Pantoea deleyi]